MDIERLIDVAELMSRPVAILAERAQTAAVSSPAAATERGGNPEDILPPPRGLSREAWQAMRARLSALVVPSGLGLADREVLDELVFDLAHRILIMPDRYTDAGQWRHLLEIAPRLAILAGVLPEEIAEGRAWYNPREIEEHLLNLAIRYLLGKVGGIDPKVADVRLWQRLIKIKPALTGQLGFRFQ